MPTLKDTYTLGNSTTPKNLDIDVAVGDLIVVFAADSTFGDFSDLPTATGVTFELLESVPASAFEICATSVWAGVSTVSDSSLTVSAEYGGFPSDNWFLGIAVFEDAQVGATTEADGGSSQGAPSGTLVTTEDNSSIFYASSDGFWASTGTRTYRTINSFTPTAGDGELWVDENDNATYGAFYPDAGTAGSKTVGMTQPNSQTWALVAVELTAGGGGGFDPRKASQFLTFF